MGQAAWWTSREDYEERFTDEDIDEIKNKYGKKSILTEKGNSRKRTGTWKILKLCSFWIVGPDSDVQSLKTPRKRLGKNIKHLKGIIEYKIHVFSFLSLKFKWLGSKIRILSSNSILIVS